MSPILVPTLSELGVEFDRAYGLEQVVLIVVVDVDASKGDLFEVVYE